MKVIIQYSQKQKESMMMLMLSKIDEPYYNMTYPKEEFDTKEDVIEYSYKADKYARWMIVPIITFDNFY